MTLRRFIGETFVDTVAPAKEAFGPHAAILPAESAFDDNTQGRYISALKRGVEAPGNAERSLPVADVRARQAAHVTISGTDEAVTLGQTLEALEVSSSPLSYVTTGQDVPNDLQPASANRLARWIVTGLAGEDVCEFHD